MILLIGIIFSILMIILCFLIPILGGQEIIVSPHFMWQVPLGFLIFFVLFAILFAISVVLYSFAIDREKEYEPNELFRSFFLRFVEVILQFSWARAVTEGLEEIPDGPCLFVSNHRGNFDPIALIWALRKRHALFVSKHENLDIPFFGKYMHKMRYIVIDREDPRKAMKTLIHCADVMKAGEDIVIYPEGTRNKNLDYSDLDNTGLLPFHNGVFKCAQMANVPIVIITTTGSENMSKNTWRRGTDIKIRVSGVIPADEVKNTKTGELGTKIANVMIENMKQMDGIDRH